MNVSQISITYEYVGILIFPYKFVINFNNV
jgi:hypothetical protein